MLMGIYLMKMFGYSLAVTVLAELAVVFLFLKFRGQAGCSRRAVALLVVLVNVLTNPPAVLICWLGRIYLPWAQIPLQIMVEGAVVAVEAYIYHSFENKLRWNMKHPVILSRSVCSGKFEFLAAGGGTYGAGRQNHGDTALSDAADFA